MSATKTNAIESGTSLSPKYPKRKVDSSTVSYIKKHRLSELRACIFAVPQIDWSSVPKTTTRKERKTNHHRLQVVISLRIIIPDERNPVENIECKLSLAGELLDQLRSVRMQNKRGQNGFLIRIQSRWERSRTCQPWRRLILARSRCVLAILWDG